MCDVPYSSDGFHTLQQGLRVPKQFFIISFWVCPSVSRLVFKKCFTVNTVYSVPNLSQFGAFPCCNRSASSKLISASDGVQVKSWLIREWTRVRKTTLFLFTECILFYLCWNLFSVYLDLTAYHHYQNIFLSTGTVSYELQLKSPHPRSTKC